MVEEGTCDECYNCHERTLGGLFGRYGKFVSNHAVKIMILCILANFTFLFGFLNLQITNDFETLYTPYNSQSFKDMHTLRHMYGDTTNSYFKSYQLEDFGKYGDILIMSKNKSNIMSQFYVDEINNIDFYIQHLITVNDATGQALTFRDLCAVDSHGCFVEGSVMLSASFQRRFIELNMTFPYFDNNFLTPVLAEVVMDNGKLISTTGVKLRYFLRQNMSQYGSLWEKKFIQTMENFQTHLTDIAYSFSDSLEIELNKNTNGDIKYFSITFSLMITFSYLALTPMNLNNVANRRNLGYAGVISSVLAIGSTFGFVSAIGVKFTNIVGVMPFLVIAIGIDGNFILLSGLADAPTMPKGSITRRIEFMMRKCGIAITMTSVTDLVAFVVGATTVFKSVQYFCIFTGIAIFFCYLNQLFFLIPAIVINDRRTKAKRHYYACCITLSSREKLLIEGRSGCFIRCCSGHYPQKRTDLDSPIETFPKKIVKMVLKSVSGRFVIFISILGYLAASIYGVLNLKQGFVFYKLVAFDSYFHKYSVWDEQYFKTEPVITLCISQTQNYSKISTQNSISSIIAKSKQEQLIDDNFEINWLNAYKLSETYNRSSEEVFVSGLIKFLTTATHFTNDIVFDAAYTKIISSKIYIKSVNIKSSTDQGNLMLGLRNISQTSSLTCFFYTPAFIFFEEFLQILPSTLQQVGISVAVLLVVTLVFMPKPVLVLVTGMTQVSILVGIFGFMYYWDLTLSSITFINLVLSVGFSVDFSVHICYAFVAVNGANKLSVLDKAIDRSGGPVLNAALSSLIGISMLALSNSYIFVSFGKMMFLAIVFGIIHAAFFLPFLLFVGFPLFKNVLETHEKKTLNQHIVSEQQEGNCDGKNRSKHVHINEGFNNIKQGEEKFDDIKESTNL